MPASLSSSYCGPPPLPDDLWGRWNFDPWLIAVMVGTVALFALRRASPRERMYFYSGVLALALVFISPLCALTVALFSARVVHHVVLVAVAAPLLALAIRPRKGLATLLTPLVLLHTVVFWLWHAPDAYASALSSTPIYWLMQVTLLGSAVLMWAAIFGASAARAIVALLLLTIQMGLLGALLVFAEQPLYLPHLVTTAAFGLQPVADQQLAGLIMWVPASLPYLAVGLWRLLAVLRTPMGRGA
jgi:putative membrane protein